MVNLKDIELLLKENTNNKDKKIYVDIKGKLIPTIWVCDISNKIILLTER